MNIFRFFFPFSNLVVLISNAPILKTILKTNILLTSQNTNQRKILLIAHLRS